MAEQGEYIWSQEWYDDKNRGGNVLSSLSGGGSIEIVPS